MLLQLPYSTKKKKNIMLIAEINKIATKTLTLLRTVPNFFMKKIHSNYR